MALNVVLNPVRSEKKLECLGCLTGIGKQAIVACPFLLLLQILKQL